MTRWASVTAGRVLNVVESPSSPGDGWVQDAAGRAEPGGTWDGTAFAPAQPASAVPQRVTRRQARQALLLAGLLDDVQPAIDAIPDATQRALAQIEWDDSQEFERQRPLLIGLAAAIGLDSAALDALFVQAATL